MFDTAEGTRGIKICVTSFLNGTLRDYCQDMSKWFKSCFVHKISKLTYFERKY